MRCLAGKAKDLAIEATWPAAGLKYLNHMCKISSLVYNFSLQCYLYAEKRDLFMVILRDV